MIQQLQGKINIVKVDDKNKSTILHSGFEPFTVSACNEEFYFLGYNTV
jgi:hypothetical protein